MAAKLSLSLAFNPNPRSEPILDGAVEPEGIQLACSRVSPGELFHRQLVHKEFDVSEMSISTLLIITAQGNRDWVALPVFTTRHFFGTQAYVRADAGIEHPSQLKGKRLGVNEYQQTAALWARGFFQHEYDVAPTDTEWYMERTEDYSHGGATGFQPPPGVKLHYIPAEKNMGEMLANGELDAIPVYFWGGGINRSTLDLSRHPKARRLFPDPVAESARYYQKTGIFPFNHTVIVRRSIYEEHPWVARNLFEAFDASKQLAYKRTREATQPWIETGVAPSTTRKALDTDVFPYGLKPNRMVVETAMQYSNEQGLTPRVLTPEEIFAPTLLDT